MSPQTVDEVAEMRDVPYRSAIGALMYLAVATRPDIACAVGQCARYMQNPGKEHWQAVKRIFRYLAGSKTMGLTYDCSIDCDAVETFSDSDWAADQDGRRSTTGYIVYLYGCAISWKSKLQHTVAHSSTEAEYMAMSDTAREIMWLRGLLSELSLIKNIKPTPVIHSEEKDRESQKTIADAKYKPYPTGDSGPTQSNTAATSQDGPPTVLLADNQGAIQLAKNPVNHERTKHIDIKHHYIREKCEEGQIIPSYINTKLNDADMFTKTTCTTDDFVSCRDRVMGTSQQERSARHAARNKERNATMKDKLRTAKENKAKKQQLKKQATAGSK
jgi:hypothetical protein